MLGTLRASRLWLGVLAALVQLLLLCLLPFLCAFSHALWTSPPCLLFLLLSTLWCWCESYVAARWKGDEPRFPFVVCHSQQTDTAPDKVWLPTVVGVTLLCLQLGVALEMAWRALPFLSLFSWIGACLMGLGIVLRLAAIMTLGPLFLNHVRLSNTHPLVTVGLYRWVRHPSETGTFCWIFGASLLGHSLWALCWGGLVCGGLILWRIRREDALLLARYPEKFPTYRASVPALFPKIL